MQIHTRMPLPSEGLHLLDNQKLARKLNKIFIG